MKKKCCDKERVRGNSVAQEEHGQREECGEEEWNRSNGEDEAQEVKTEDSQGEETEEPRRKEPGKTNRGSVGLNPGEVNARLRRSVSRAANQTLDQGTRGWRDGLGQPMTRIDQLDTNRGTL